jgi:twitching motility protein PilT
MPLVDSLLTAIVRSDGDALVLHVGEKPYVVAATGSVELSRQGLGLGAMEGLLAQLLSAEALRALREMGAVEHELTASPAAGSDRFTVVAARGGDDIWIEVRRHRRVRPAAPAVVAAPADGTAVSASEAAHPVLAAEAIEPRPDVAEAVAEAPAPAVEHVPEVPAVAEMVATASAAAADVPVEAPIVEVVDTPVDAPVAEPVAEAPIVAVPFAATEPLVEFAAAPPVEAPAAASFAADDSVAPFAIEQPTPIAPETWISEQAPVIDFEAAAAEAAVASTPVPAAEPVAPVEPAAPVEPVPVVAAAPPPPPPPVAVPVASEPPLAQPPAPEPVAVAAPEPPPVRLAEPTPIAPAAAASPAPMAAESAPPPQPAPVATPAAPRYDVPAAAHSPHAPMLHADTAVPEPPAYPPIEPQPTLPGLPVAAFDVEATRPEPVLEPPPGVVLSLTRDTARATAQASRAHGRAGGIERLLRLAAARGASALYLTTQARPAVRVDGDIRLLEGEASLSSGDVEAAVLELAPDGIRDKESAEWTRDLQDIGRVRITTFRDYRGPGALLRMISARATSAEQLGLVREIQALATEPEGLVIVTGPRASGKSTLVSAYVDLINRQRNDYVITLEGQIRLVHESRGSLISQRELRGSAAEVVAAARAALRENPDVLVIEDLRSPDVLQVALDAAGSGLLVFASVTAASATAALERLVDLCPSEQRRTVRAALAEHLRGVVAQVLLRKSGGGRLAARELVLNTNAVAALVSDGQMAQLPRAIDSGRKLGMAPLNDALVAFVQSGAVDVREAYRKADDKVGLLGLLRREGIDTSFVERLA